MTQQFLRTYIYVLSVNHTFSGAVTWISLHLAPQPVVEKLWYHGILVKQKAIYILDNF